MLLRRGLPARSAAHLLEDRLGDVDALPNNVLALERTIPGRDHAPRLDIAADGDGRRGLLARAHGRNIALSRWESHRHRWSDLTPQPQVTTGAAEANLPQLHFFDCHDELGILLIPSQEIIEGGLIEYVGVPLRPIN